MQPPDEPTLASFAQYVLGAEVAALALPALCRIAIAPHGELLLRRTCRSHRALGALVWPLCRPARHVAAPGPGRARRDAHQLRGHRVVGFSSCSHRPPCLAAPSPLAWPRRTRCCCRLCGRPRRRTRAARDGGRGGRAPAADDAAVQVCAVAALPPPPIRARGRTRRARAATPAD